MAESSSSELRCGSCRKQPPDFERLVAAFLYQPPGDTLIRGLKFGRLEYLGEDLAALLAEPLQAWTTDLDLVVPVPLHWSRRLIRGYNQAERIARPLAAALDLPCVAALRRGRWTRPQTALTREERTRSQRQSFRLSSGADIRDASVLLVDDVMTTGATLRAAAAVLRRGGAARVIAAVAARTPGAEEATVALSHPAPPPLWPGAAGGGTPGGGEFRGLTGPCQRPYTAAIGRKPR